MDAGAVIAGQFEIERVAGAGGMGRVYRALDRATHAPVAIKILRRASGRETRRFMREARLLAELRHPGIVRYIAHGVTDAGQPYLVMEWLDGVPLRDRMHRRALSLTESVTMARRVSEALAAAHERRIVHRDIKPSNVMLIGGRVDEVKLLDFGIARWHGADDVITHPGASVGTPGYMAPEQARGEREVDARADVYALGCVMFECLTGQRPFRGVRPVAVLAKTVLAPAPRASALRRDVPPRLDALIASMLANDPDARPRDGAAVASALDLTADALAPLPGAEPPPGVGLGLTRDELRLVCVILIAGGPLAASAPTEATPAPPDASRPPDTPRGGSADGADDGGGRGDGDSWGGPRDRSWVDTRPTRTSPDGDLRALTAVAARFDGRIHRLANGSVLVAMLAAAAATDLVERAARCALALRGVTPGARMSLATGRGVLADGAFIGEAIDRAARLLDELTGEPTANEHTGESTADDAAPGVRRADAIRIDSVTAGLLGSRFDVGGDAASLDLRGERPDPEVPRRLLGRPSAFVGRRRDLGFLESLFARCADDGAATAALVIGPPGIGKSRLRHELLRRLRESGRAGTIWMARGDWISAQSPFAMMGRLLADAAGIREGEPLAVRRRKLSARVRRHVPDHDAARIAEFLGEIASAPFPGAGRVQLQVARDHAVVMGAQLRRAWEDFLAAEAASAPTVVVLEDLHWGDLPTVQMIDSALRNVSARPWMLLALARPEVDTVFPRLWSERPVQRLHLGKLGARACTALIRDAVGPDVPAAVTARLTSLADGNAFYLEELIRAVATGSAGELPGTVLAMAQARLERLPGEARRILRAASVFGRVFWRGGVRALVAGVDAAAVDRWLRVLVERELIDPRPTSRIADERELVFRHDIVREVAYQSLTEADRVLGHSLAAAWLEQAGERDPVVLAVHFERGREPASAIALYHRGASVALDGNDTRAALDLAERGVACGAGGPTLGALRLIQALAHMTAGELADAERRSAEAMQRLPRGSELWYRAAAELANTSGRLGRLERLVELAAEIADAPRDRAAANARVLAVARAAGRLFLVGRAVEAAALFDRLAVNPRELEQTAPQIAGHLYDTRAIQRLCRGDPSAYLATLERSAMCYERAGDLYQLCIVRVNMGFAYTELGAPDRAESVLRHALSVGERIALASVVAVARNNLGRALCHAGQLDEAEALERAAIEAFAGQGDQRLESGSRVYLAHVLERAGKLDEAEREARRAIAGAAGIGTIEAQAHGRLASILLRAGRVDDAAEAAEQAVALHRRLQIDEGESQILLVHARALHAAGRVDQARAALADAHARLLARAGRLGDATWRDSFLRRVADHADTVALARDWGVAT